MGECGSRIDDIMCDDIICEDLRLTSMARMDDITRGDLIFVGQIQDVCENVVFGLMI